MAKLHVPKKWCEKHEDFYNPLLGCPDCKAEVLQLEAEADEADANCRTLPNGDCIGGPCMHDIGDPDETR